LQIQGAAKKGNLFCPYNGCLQIIHHDGNLRSIPHLSSVPETLYGFTIIN